MALQFPRALGISHPSLSMGILRLQSYIFNVNGLYATLVENVNC